MREYLAGDRNERRVLGSELTMVANQTRPKPYVNLLVAARWQRQSAVVRTAAAAAAADADAHVGSAAAATVDPGAASSITAARRRDNAGQRLTEILDKKRSAIRGETSFDVAFLWFLLSFYLVFFFFF